MYSFRTCSALVSRGDDRSIRSIRSSMWDMRTVYVFLATILMLPGIAAQVAELSSNMPKRNHSHHPPVWLVNNPSHLHDGGVLGRLVDIRNDSANMTDLVKFLDYHLARVDGFTDGEVVDAIEHFFWGMTNGVAMELGALDGSPGTRSQTFEYEKTLGWKRILIEGNPSYRSGLISNSPKAFSVNAAICEKATTVHYSGSEYVGGIIEFMGQSFMKEYHGRVYNACNPPGNVSTLNFTAVQDILKMVDCVPLSIIMRKARARHVNYFILDVEGGEFEVLKSIDWKYTRFDVLAIETEEQNRPPGFAAKITSYLAERGYKNVTVQQGRNTWYIRDDFVPFTRPGLDAQCYNGARKSQREDAWFLNRRTPKFKRCPMAL